MAIETQSEIEAARHAFSRVADFVIASRTSKVPNDRLEREYKRFMAIAANVKVPISMTSAEVDDVWHRHLLNQASYLKFCSLLGATVGHLTSAEAKTTLGESEERASNFARIYEKAFGTLDAVWTNNGSAALCVATVSADGAQKSLCQPT